MVEPKLVMKSVGPRLVPFFKTVALFFVMFPNQYQQTLYYCLFKCMPIVSLMAFVLMHGINLSDYYAYNRRILLGLVFSCLGDASLVWKGYFVYGLIFFSIAHVMYIWAFGLHPLSIRDGAMCFALGTLFYSYIHSSLSGILVYLVPVYVILLSAMAWRALARVQIMADNWTWTKICAMFGAISFVISDFLLSVNLFKFRVPYSQPLVMCTYYAAQLGISLSVVNTPTERAVQESIHGAIDGTSKCAADNEVCSTTGGGTIRQCRPEFEANMNTRHKQAHDAGESLGVGLI